MIWKMSWRTTDAAIPIISACLIRQSAGLQANRTWGFMSFRRTKYRGKSGIFQSSNQQNSKPTCFVQKCQSFSTSAFVFLLTNHQTAIKPPNIPNTATLLTQTSIKQGVKSYLSPDRGPHPSLFPHNASGLILSAERYPDPSV
jgi:hypothetical protein